MRENCLPVQTGYGNAFAGFCTKGCVFVQDENAP